MLNSHYKRLEIFIFLLYNDFSYKEKEGESTHSFLLAKLVLIRTILSLSAILSLHDVPLVFLVHLLQTEAVPLVYLLYCRTGVLQASDGHTDDPKEGCKELWARLRP